MKNTTKAKFAAGGLAAIALFGACKQEPNDKPGTEIIIPQEVQRTFTIPGFAKPITVKDMRTGKDDKDLKELEIISRLTTGLTAVSTSDDADCRARFEKAVGFNLVIVVEDPAGAYQRMFAYSGNRMGVNIAYISTDQADLFSRMFTVFETMFGKEPDSVAKAIQPKHDRGWQRLTAAKIRNGNRIAKHMTRARLG